MHALVVYCEQNKICRTHQLKVCTDRADGFLLSEKQNVINIEVFTNP